MEAMVPIMPTKISHLVELTVDALKSIKILNCNELRYMNPPPRSKYKFDIFQI